MKTYVVLRRHGWKSTAELERAAARSARVGSQDMPDRVRWIRSYVIREPDGMLGTVCIYEGSNPDAVREHAERSGLPCDDVMPVVETVIINDDPVRDAASP